MAKPANIFLKEDEKNVALERSNIGKSFFLFFFLFFLGGGEDSCHVMAATASKIREREKKTMRKFLGRFM